MIDKTRMSVPPFLKWAGGKRWLVQTRADLFDVPHRRLIEPFVGSGAVFFHMRPKRAVLADSNADLIATYQAIKTNWKAVAAEVERHADLHCEEHYYEVRALNGLDSLYQRAGRFIYLNRTCWNGLYRVNRQGHFNVPIGTKQNVVLDSDDFELTAHALSNAQILHSDFGPVIEAAMEGDLLFVDPPYTVKHNLNGFVKYNETIFSWDDQVRLATQLRNADLRGVRILMTNADHESVRDLYAGHFELESTPRMSVLAGRAGARGKVTELLVRNW